jgi:hypothetical protein
MSWASVNYGYWEFWEAYNPSNQTFGQQKVTFDGENRLIYVNPGETTVYVKDDIYSAWKEWVQVRNNAQFLDAMRTTGGDPVGGGLFAGDIYFTVNDWKVVIQEQVVVNGIIYDNTPGVSPFIVQPGGGVRNVVSNLAYAYNITGVTPPSVQEIRQEMDANSSKLIDIKTKVDTLNNAPTVVQIRTEIDSNSTKLQQISDKQDQALTKGDFLALQ